MSDRPQELRAQLDVPHQPNISAAFKDRVAREALDGWEKAENVNTMLKKALAAKVGAKRAPLKGSDLEFVLERAERAEAERDEARKDGFFLVDKLVRLRRAIQECDVPYCGCSSHPVLAALDTNPNVRDAEEALDRIEDYVEHLQGRDAQLTRLRERVRAAMDNIGVPGPDYPANIAVAYDILNGCLPESQENPDHE